MQEKNMGHKCPMGRSRVNQSKKYHCCLLFWYGICESHGTRNKRLRL